MTTGASVPTQFTEDWMAGSDRLRININRNAEAIVVTFAGDLDVFVADDAHAHNDEAINRAVAHSVERVLVDGSRLGFCDSTGLSVFVRARDAAAQRGVQLALQNISRPLRELLELAGLEPFVEREP
jgi:anti-anti-sigma factor